MFLSQHLSVRAKEERTDIFAHSLTLLSWPEAAVIILLFKTLVQTAWLKGQTEPPHLQEPTLWRHKHLYRCQSCHPTEISQGTLSAQEAAEIPCFANSERDKGRVQEQVNNQLTFLNLRQRAGRFKSAWPTGVGSHGTVF